MESEPSVHAFIIRIWLEEAASEADPAIWRGHVTHAMTQERRYIEHLNEIPRFIAPYLAEMGVPPPRHSRVCRWLQRWCG